MQGVSVQIDPGAQGSAFELGLRSILCDKTRALDLDQSAEGVGR